MKEYDIVRLLIDRESYNEEGIYKGMEGVILDPRCIDGHWHVCFEGKIFQNSEGVYCTTEKFLAVKEEDLEVLEKYSHAF